MPFNGSGTFDRSHRWVDDKAAHREIDAVRMDREDDGIRDGLTNAICLDGQSTTLAAIPFAVGLQVSNGTVGAPSVGIIGDTNCGLYRVAANTVGIVVAGTKIIEVATATTSVNAVLALSTPLATTYGGTGAATANTCRVYATATQSCAATSSDVPLVFNLTAHDPNSLHDASGATATQTKITVSKDGVYLINGQINLAVLHHSYDGVLLFAIKKNDTDYLAQVGNFVQLNDPDVDNWKATITTIAQLTAGDYVQLVSQNNNNGLSIRTSATPSLAVARIYA